MSGQPKNNTQTYPKTVIVRPAHKLAHNLRPLTTQHPGGAAFVSDDQSTAGIVSSVTSNRHNWLLGYEAEDFCKKVLHLQIVGTVINTVFG